jgi:multidrug resistance efflux pump
MMQVSVEPALRKDLLISRQETPEGVQFVVKDPLAERYFRFREAEYAVVRRLDGTMPLDAVAQQLTAELNAEVDAEALQPFVEQLRAQGLLEGHAPPPAPARRVRGSALYLRFNAFDPDRLLDRMLPWVRPFFTPQFVVGSAALVLWATATVVTEWGAILRDLAGLWSFQNLLLAWVLVLTVTAAHEFAHALTCKHFGGRVREIGFMLIYFQPAFYCNISDAWLFPQRSRRLWVTAAGAYFELFLWGLATLIWRVVEPGTWVSGLALIVMATSAFKQFFNLNPLIKLDGYYLLSDLLEVPNLRQRAFAYLGGLLQRVTGGAPRAPVEASVRERRIFLGYGLIAVVFSYWLLAKIAYGMGLYLTNRWQGWGFAMFTAFLGLMFPQPIRRLFKRGEAPPEPKQSGFTRRAKLGVLAAGVVTLAFVAPLEQRVGGAVELLPMSNTDVRAAVEGILERFYVEEGDRVVAGDTIVRLSSRDYVARLHMVEAQLREKRARLSLLRAGPRQEEVALARLAVGKAEGRLRFAETEAERLRGLAAKQLVSRTELERAEERLAVLAKEHEEEQARLDVMLAGNRPEQIAAMEQDVAHSEAERLRLEEQLAQLVVTAPHGGIVTTPRLREKIGEYARPGDLIAEIYAIETVTADIAISERDIGEVRVGHGAALRFRAYPGRTFEGRVTRIAPAVVQPGVGGRTERTVRVEVELPNPDGVLRPGMTGYARISSGERRAIEVLTRRFRRFVRVEFWSWW